MKVWSSIIVACFVGLHPFASEGQTSNGGAEFRNLLRIVPIESTAADVRKLLGEPLDKSPDFYKLKDNNVLITYSSGLPCNHRCYEKGRSDGWNVPRDTVISVAIFVKEPFHQKDLKNFGIDLNTYKKLVEADHIPNTIYYSNAEQGIGINVNGDQVNDIAFFPAAKYFPSMCPLTNDKPPCEKGDLCGNWLTWVPRLR